MTCAGAVRGDLRGHQYVASERVPRLRAWLDVEVFVSPMINL